MTFTAMTNRAAGYVVQESDWDNLTNNMDHLNTGFHVPLFPFSSGIAPASGLQAAAYSVVQSSGAGTVKPEYPILAFDSSTDEGRIWNFRLPRGYGSTITVVGTFYTSATSGNTVLAAQLAMISDTDTSVTAKVYATENSSTVAVPGAAGTLKAFSITMSNADSAAAGDWGSLAFRRDADNASDTVNSNDINLTMLDLYFSLA